MIVRLEYTPDGATSTLLFSGKGITYDTGGADVKAGGHMAGMSRDKVSRCWSFFYYDTHRLSPSAAQQVLRALWRLRHCWRLQWELLVRLINWFPSPASNITLSAELGFVRNSVGADSYVADEIIVAHSGARVLIGNTDAEGRYT